MALLVAARTAAAAPLSAADVEQVVARAASDAQRAGLAAWIAVTDDSGAVIGLYRMAGAPDSVRVTGTRGRGIEGQDLSAGLAAISKAGTGAFLSSGGNAFSTRTGSFIVQEHFPPKVDETPGGPLFGVQFSSITCSDVQRPALPFGIAGDPGGVPLYRDGAVVGGVGVEAATYGIDLDPEAMADADDQLAEEHAALAGQGAFAPPPAILAEKIYADGIRLPYANTAAEGAAGALPAGTWVVTPRGGTSTRFVPATRGGVAGMADPRLPTHAGTQLSASEVDAILTRAAEQTVRTRAAIRQPLGSYAHVSIAVVDVGGAVLGFFQNADAPWHSIGLWCSGATR